MHYQSKHAVAKRISMKHRMAGVGIAGAAYGCRRWPADRWAEVARALSAEGCRRRHRGRELRLCRRVRLGPRRRL